MRNHWLVYLFILNIFFTASYAKSHHPQDFLKKIEGTPNEGEQIYKHFCSNCHAKNPLIKVGAPKIGDSNDWSMRLKQGINSLYEHTDQGFNAMPARGGCFECSDKQLFMAILYMMPKDAQKGLIKKLSDHKKDGN